MRPKKFLIFRQFFLRPLSITMNTDVSPPRYMSYVTFDASLVPFFRYPFYGPQSQSYPDIKKIAYPKAGFPNPLVKVTIVKLEDKEKKTVHVKPPVEISSGEHYYSVRCL